MANPFTQYQGLALGAEEIKALTDWPDALVEDYAEIFNTFRTYGAAINNSVMIVGTGAPNGNVTSNDSRQYFDTAGAAGARFWVNPDVGENTGWVAIN